jgi:anthrone oxygenase-like protein
MTVVTAIRAIVSAWGRDHARWEIDMLAGHLALIVAAVFAGAAFYITAVEQPARLTLDDQALLAEWKPSYKRGFVMQAPLAVAGLLFGTTAWLQTDDAAFLLGAVVMIANWPWTLLGIMPTNNALMAIDPAAAPPETRPLIIKWAGLHAVRTVLGGLATLAFLWGCMSEQITAN